MSEPNVLAIVAVIALLLGLAIGWFAGRGRSAAIAAAASAEAKSAVQGELATLTERSNSLNTALHSAHQERTALQQNLDASRTQLDIKSNEIARLTERASQLSQQLGDANSELVGVRQELQTTMASLQQANEARASFEEQARRIPELVSEATVMDARIEEQAAELRQVSTENSQNTERAKQVSQQLAEANSTLAETQQRLESMSTALQQANEAKAGLEEQARRLPSLEQQLVDTSQRLSDIRDELAQQREATSSEISRLSAELSAEREALAHSRQDGASSRLTVNTAAAKVSELTAELTELRTRSDDERAHAAEKLKMLLEAKEALSDQFKTLATEILEEKGKRFAEQNQTNLGQLLDPLRHQLAEFKGKVEEVYVQEGKDRSALSEQVRQLVSLNQTLSQDAKSLTMALKGQAKTQGNWGELILERVLEASGLRKGFEYKVQDSQVREDGSRAQPDVVIELPEDRKLVVDAKVSLVAYERFVSGETEEERAVALKQHLASVREHIRGLSEKSYHQLYALQSLDFVLAFIPVEPAFMMAVTNDNDLFMDAWQRNVLLVSPSTLLFVVRTVAHLWRQEAQSRNAQDIAKRGALLYDKLVGFAADLQKVGDKLSQAKSSYDDAHSKLVGGTGNVIRQAEMLKGLGVKPTKALPKVLIDAAGGDEEIVLPVPALAALTAPSNQALAGTPANRQSLPDEGEDNDFASAGH